MKNIGLLLSSVVVIECCVMSTEVKADVPKTSLNIYFPEELNVRVASPLAYDYDSYEEKNFFNLRYFKGSKSLWQFIPKASKGGCIIFPDSARQPTTKDAAVYSGAKVAVEADKDGADEACKELNKKITSWYMYVFGGKDVEQYVDVKIEADDAVFPKFAPGGGNIINFDKGSIDIKQWKKEQKELINGKLEEDKEEQKEQLKKFDEYFANFNIEDFKRVFWTRFKTIASDPVGRVLLYRILIEIWRTYDADYTDENSAERFAIWEKGKNKLISSGEGAVEHFEGDEASYFKKERMDKRNKCRSLNITIGGGGAFWQGGAPYGEAFIRINPNHNSKPTVVKVCLKGDKENKVVKIGEQQFNSSRKLVITREKYPADVSLFHEMLHWLHFLRNPMRFGDEHTKIGDRRYAHVLECYYGKKNSVFPNDAVLAWIGNSFSTLSGDEVRTILGAPDENDERIVDLLPPIDEKSFSDSQRELRNSFQWKRDSKFLNGDDLSENAYRLSRYTLANPISMRFGHTDLELTANLIDKSEQDKLLQVTTTTGFHPSTLEIAYNVVMNCYKDITGKKKNVWNFDLMKPKSKRYYQPKIRPVASE